METHQSGMWIKAVLVEIEFEEETAIVQIENTLQAAECLSLLWPDSDGAAFTDAVRICSDAMDGTADDESARDAFFAAAVEAEIAVAIH